MADSARPPVAIRIVRPYETEEAFLESELETVGKTSIILIGAQSRPTGVILRFEVTLASGASVLRGEGRVLAHKENAFRGQAGLALRFTRLDPKSKAVVDRAAAIREARLGGDGARVPIASPSTTIDAVASPVSVRTAPASVRPAPVHASQPPDPSLTQALTAPTPEPPAVDAATTRSRRSAAPLRSERPRSVTPRAPEARSSVPPLANPPAPAAQAIEQVENASGALIARPTNDDDASAIAAQRDDNAGAPAAGDVEVAAATATEQATPLVEPQPSAAPSPAPSAPVADESARTVSRPRDRDGLLARLRERAANLTSEQKASILGS